MFIGHFAPAFAARAITDEAPRLGVLFIAAQLLDWAFFSLALFGVEAMRLVPGITAMNAFDLYDMPISHSLLGAAGFALAFAVFVMVRYRNPVAATWAALVVISHWFLDLVSHRPDLTFAGGKDKFGFGLWDWPLVAIAFELAITGLAFWWYLRRTKGPVVPPIVLGVTLLALQLADWFAPKAAELSAATYLMPLGAFALLTGLALWVQSTRWHRQHVGLAVASVRR